MKYADRVKETTATTGTGTLTLAGAVVGFRTFMSALVDGDLVPYVLEAANGTDWETGIGTYSAGTLARTVISASSNSNNALNLAAGSHTVYLGLIARNLTDQREVLTAARTYYVAATGSDSNNGLSAGSPFLTIQKAINTIYSLDLTIYNVTISVADGTYSEALTFALAFLGSGTVTLQGNTTTPANCILATSGATGITVSGGAQVTIDGFKISTASSMGVSASQSRVRLKNIDFAVPGTQIFVTSGGYVSADTGYTISASAAYHVRSISTGLFQCSSQTITVSGTPAFSGAFMLATQCGVIQANGNTYSGSATGKRYDAQLNGVIATTGGTLPGSVAGTTATGGQYT